MSTATRQRAGQQSNSMAEIRIRFRLLKNLKRSALSLINFAGALYDKYKNTYTHICSGETWMKINRDWQKVKKGRKRNQKCKASILLLMRMSFGLLCSTSGRQRGGVCWHNYVNCAHTHPNTLSHTHWCTHWLTCSTSCWVFDICCAYFN